MTNYHLNAAGILLATTFLTKSVFAGDITNSTQLQEAIAAGGDYTLTGNIATTANLGTVASNLTINGNGFGIDGINTHSGFVVNNGATLDLQNIGTNGSGFRGFSHNIVNNGIVNINNVNWIRNKTAEPSPIYGGVIQNHGTLTIDNSIFDGNVASSTDRDLWGGIIDNGHAYTAPAAYIVKISNSIFRNNIANTLSPSVLAPHGAVIQNSAHIGTIENVIFENNQMYAPENSWGGAHGTAIDNNEHGVIDLITDSKFINNKTYRVGTTIYTDGRNYHASGGALDNYNVIGTIQNSLFEGNSAESEASSVTGGAMMLGRSTGSESSLGIVDRIDNVVFKNNYVKNTYNGHGNSGAIAQWGTLNHLTNTTFEGNYVYTKNGMGYGGAIYNSYIIKEMDNVKFIGNHVDTVDDQAIGGAIRNAHTIDKISNTIFSGNYIHAINFNAVGGAFATGGANANIKEMNSVVFDGNYAISDTSNIRGGAMINSNQIDIMSNVVFKNNYAKAATYAHGGALHNTGVIGKIENATFTENYVQGDATSAGGAIYSSANLNIAAKDANTIFSGNKVNDKANDIYMVGVVAAPIDLNLYAQNGTIAMDGGVDGVYYDINVSGTGTVRLDNTIKGADAVNVEDATLKFRQRESRDEKGRIDNNSATSLTLKNATFDINNGYNETIKLKGYSATNSTLHMDVNPNTMTADVLDIDGNVEGTTKLIVHASSNKDIRGLGSILFAQSTNDTTGSENSFTVARVYTSPYLYDVIYAADSSTDKKWSLEMDNDNNPNKEPEPEDPDPYPTPESLSKVKVAPEVVSYIGLASASLEQNRGLARTIVAQITAEKRLGCALDTKDAHRLWIDAGYLTSSNDEPAQFDADIWGVTAGGNLQADRFNQLGLFTAYRKGQYDFSGEGNRYYSTIGSEISIDSYIGGLYYRFDRYGWYTMATVYGGTQKADINTNDHVIQTESDGNLWGAGIESGQSFALTRTLSLEPSLGVFYTQANLDDIKDKAGKTVEYDTLSQFEVEAGIKLENSFCQNNFTSRVYVKPSVIRTITSGDSVKITGLNQTSTYNDQTLGRIEVGARFGIINNLSAYGWANYTFGSSYDATAIGAGLNYAF